MKTFELITSITFSIMFLLNLIAFSVASNNHDIEGMVSWGFFATFALILSSRSCK